MKKLGLIKGRHPLPVDDYIVDWEVKKFTKKELAPKILERLEKLGVMQLSFTAPEHVKLYLTGLTIVALTTIELLIKLGYIVHVMGFNPETQEYYEQGIF